MNKKIALTIGDPCGIGAEIVIKALEKLNLNSNEIVVIGNRKVLEYYGAGADFFSKYEIIDLPYEEKNICPGKLLKEAGDFAYRVLLETCRLAKENRIGAIVTAPTAKEAMILAGYNFSGQTEVLERYLAHDGQKAQMLFCSDKLNVLLLTRHIPLRRVSEYITKEMVIETITSLHRVFTEQFLIKNPKFALCGLNPHAGEGGFLGEEENLILKPAAEFLRKEKIDITDPIPADALFAKIGKCVLENRKSEYDCVVAIYHDQGLIPVKMLLGKKAVNTTIGLDILRTSPAHGTAFDIAGKNIANTQSMEEALKFACKFLNKQC